MKKIACAGLALSFSPTAESFGVSAQIGSGVVRGGPEVRFQEGSTRVPPWFHEGSTRFCEGCAGWCEHKKSTACWGYYFSRTLKIWCFSFWFPPKKHQQNQVPSKSGLAYSSPALYSPKTPVIRLQATRRLQFHFSG